MEVLCFLYRPVTKLNTASLHKGFFCCEKQINRLRMRNDWKRWTNRQSNMTPTLSVACIV